MCMCFCAAFVHFPMHFNSSICFSVKILRNVNYFKNISCSVLRYKPHDYRMPGFKLDPTQRMDVTWRRIYVRQEDWNVCAVYSLGENTRACTNDVVKTPTCISKRDKVCLCSTGAKSSQAKQLWWLSLLYSWVRKGGRGTSLPFSKGEGQCWSESGLVSPARPESESESESIRPESESIRCESESIWPESESESESTGPESESESESSGSESESESASPTKVRVSPDLSPDSAWTHESNNRKCFISTLLLIIFDEPCIDDNW